VSGLAGLSVSPLVIAGHRPIRRGTATLLAVVVELDDLMFVLGRRLDLIAGVALLEPLRSRGETTMRLLGRGKRLPGRALILLRQLEAQRTLLVGAENLVDGPPFEEGGPIRREIELEKDRALLIVGTQNHLPLHLVDITPLYDSELPVVVDVRVFDARARAAEGQRNSWSHATSTSGVDQRCPP